MSLNARSYFKEIVENIFNRWTALKLAVEHGMAGQNGLQVSPHVLHLFTFIYIEPCLLIIF
jgi:hypothetical protein